MVPVAVWATNFKFTAPFNVSALRGSLLAIIISASPMCSTAFSTVVGKRPCLGVFGNDYDTPDGTGVRDYIHVVDLAAGHVKAIEKLRENPGVEVYNLGTGNGYSVLQVVAAFEKACGHEIPYEIKPRREGDIATCYCDPQKAKEDLGWEAKYGIEEMCEDSWRWQSTNPDGYATK